MVSFQFCDQGFSVCNGDLHMVETGAGEFRYLLVRGERCPVEV